MHAHPAGAAPAAPWRPFRELTQRPEPLRRRVASVRAALAARGGLRPDEIELKVAASVAQLGLVARLIAPALGAAVTGHRVDLRLDGLWWQDELGGPVPLSVPVAASVPATGSAPPTSSVPATGSFSTSDSVPPAGAVPLCDPVPVAERPAGEAALHRFLDEVVAPVTAATQAQAPVAGRVLWGNVASGINAAARLTAASRPDLAGDAWHAAEILFASPLLRGERQPPGPAFRRASCCLIYRVMPGGPAAVCGDCVLNARGRQETSGAAPPGQEPS